MSKGVGQPGYRVRFRPGEVRPSRRGRRIRGFQELFVGVTRAAYWVGLALLLLYALYQSYYLIYETSYLRLENVLVSGNQVLTKQEILGLTGIELGSHFFKYKPKEIKTVLLTHPRVLEASVEQMSPKTLAIHIVENRPYCRTSIAGQLLEVGEDGRLLGAAASGASTLPLFLGMPEETTGTAGDRPPRSDGKAAAETSGVAKGSERLREGRPRLESKPLPHEDAAGERPCQRISRDLFAQLPGWLAVLRGSFLADFEAVDFRNPYRIEVQWRGMRMFVGDPGDIKEMAPHVQATLADAERRLVGIGSMDLRFHMLVVKYQAAPTAATTRTVDLVALAPLVTSTAATAIETAEVSLPPMPPVTEVAKAQPLTAHPAVLAAASTTAAAALEPTTPTTAMFDEQELMALAQETATTATALPASKPGFDSHGEESDEAPDPGYIYNPPAMPRDEGEDSSANAEQSAENRFRLRRQRSQEGDGAH